MILNKWTPEKKEEIKEFLLDEGLNPFVLAETLTLLLESIRKVEECYESSSNEMDVYADNMVYVMAWFAKDFARPLTYIKKVLEEDNDYK